MRGVIVTSVRLGTAKTATRGFTRGVNGSMKIKLDGFRMAARIDNGRAQLFTGARRLQRRCAMPRSPVDGLNGGRIVRAGGAGNEPRREAGRVSLGAPATLTGAWVP
jgi:hypothetical protein